MTRIAEIKRLLIPREDPVIVEVGACFFDHTRVFLDTFSDVRLYTFEPHPRVTPSYAHLIGDDPRCTLFPVAVGDRDGTTPMHLAQWVNEDGESSRQWEYSSSIVDCADHSPQYPNLHFPEVVEVPVTRLDTWAQAEDVDHVDFIWTDVQGAERQLIDGAPELLKRTDYVQLEFGERGPYPGASLTKEETIALLAGHGFEVVPEFTRENRWGPNGEWNAGDLLFRRVGATV